MSGNVHDVIRSLDSVLKSAKRPVALHEPTFAGNEWQYVKECLDTGWVSSVGKFVDTFEQKLAEYTGAARAVAMVNGTAALHIALKLSGVKTGDEVLMPALTFIATANAVAYCGATPHFVDCDERTLAVDPVKLGDYLKETVQVDNGIATNRKTGKVVRALIVVHAFGHSADLDAVVEVCERFKIAMIEDAAESLGTFYKGKHTGTIARLSALSFNGNKIVTTGGGGAILTNDAELGKLAKHMTTTAKVPHAWKFEHDMVGYNYRMPNINAALGCAQIEKLPGFLSDKRQLALKYEAAFAGVKGVKFYKEPSFSKSNYWLNVLLLDESSEKTRDEYLEKLNAAGFGCRPAWTLMHKLPMYSSCPKMDLTCSESIERRLINIPSGSALLVK